MSDNENKPAASRPQGGPMMGGRVVEKPKDFKKSWSKLIQYSKKHMVIIGIAMICSITSSVLTLMGPDRLSKITNIITDGLMTTIDLDAIKTVVLTLILLYGISALLAFIQGYMMTTVTQRISKNLRSAISTKINRLPIFFFNKTSHGDVLSRVTNDVDNIGQSLNQSIVQLVSAVTLLLGSVIMMFRNNVIMAFTAIGASFIGFILMAFIMGKSQIYFKRRQKHLGDINGHIEEVYSGHNIVKVYNGEKLAKEQFEEINAKLYDSNWKSQFLSGLMMPLMGFIGNLGYVAVCVVGAALVMNGSITFGVIVAFMVYVRLFTQPLSQIAQAATSLQSTAASSERVFDFLEEQEMEDESYKTKHIDRTTGDVEFRNVKFGYEDDDKIIIHNFSEHAKPGQKIAIVGPTGAGKTTMVNLLMRFNEINSGEILIDGISTKDLKRENVHEQFCMVLQDTWLFEGTIRENIVYCKENVTDEQVKQACKTVGLHHFIKTLPEGYNTILNDSANMSAGQKQLLTIARAMILDAPLLILDEATSSVDTRTEVLIQEAMDKLTVGRTSFVIAHRLSTIKNADVILVMKDGDIIESGNHEELLGKDGFYAQLYNSQFETA